MLYFCDRISDDVMQRYELGKDWRKR